MDFWIIYSDGCNVIMKRRRRIQTSNIETANWITALVLVDLWGFF